MKNPMTIHLDSSETLHYNYENFPIYTSKDLLSNYDYQALIHWHPDLEFIYILEGSMDFFVNGNILTLTKNSLLFINSQRLHYGFSKEKQECSFIELIISPDILPECCQDYFKKKFGLKNKDYLYFNNKDMNHDIIDLILQVHQMMSPHEFNSLLILSKSLILFNEIGKYLNSYEQNQHNTLDQDLFLQLTTYISKHYNEKITLSLLSKEVGISRNKCCHLFTTFTNTTPNEYLTNYRITKSVELLRSTHLSITEISSLCGFSSPSYFTSVFSKKKGITPNKIKKMVK